MTLYKSSTDGALPGLLIVTMVDHTSDEMGSNGEEHGSFQGCSYSWTIVGIFEGNMFPSQKLVIEAAALRGKEHYLM